MRVHFIGIGGIGLSALARFLKYRGYEVSGSDVKETPITKKLKEEGIRVNIPQSADVISGQDLVIYSAAVSATNTERMEAKEQNLRVLSRKEALPIILKETKNYCVCAAHGKSTTTAMLSSILDSSALIGAISKEFDSNFRYIDDILAFEADESDGSFILSNPYCSIVLNTEPEHMEYYDYDESLFYDSYKKFLDIASYRVINAEDPFLATYDNNAVRLYPSEDIKKIEYILIENEPYTRFELKDYGVFMVWGVGKHIALDASMAILAAKESMDMDSIRKNLLNYKGIKKRFDIITKTDNILIIDDYAHHPTEIAATLNSINLYKDTTKFNKVTTIWQPHKYTRTIDNLENFKKCFMGTDTLIILPVWAVNETIVDIDFPKEFQEYHPIFADYIKKVEDSIVVYKDENIIKILDKDIVLGVGAGDITYQLRGEK